MCDVSPNLICEKIVGLFDHVHTYKHTYTYKHTCTPAHIYTPLAGELPMTPAVTVSSIHWKEYVKTIFWERNHLLIF